MQLSCISQSRFSSDVQKLKNATDCGAFGKLNSATMHTRFYRNQNYYKSVEGRGTWAIDGGGALMIQGYHYIDLMQHIMGRVEEVMAYCTTRAHEIEVEDIAVGILKFESGAIGTLEASTAAFPGFDHRLWIYGDDGAAELRNNQLETWRIRNDKMQFDTLYGYEIGALQNQNHMEDTQIIKGEEFEAQLRDFISAIQQKHKPFVTPNSAIHTLEIIQGIYESARTNAVVKLMK